MGLYVFTGGAHAGKTTVARELAKAGVVVIPEAGTEMLEELNAIMGVESQTRWRKENRVAYHYMTLFKQWNRERALNRKGPNVILDRALGDRIAYFRLLGVEIPGFLDKAVRDAGYEKIFVFDPVTPFDDRTKEGRFTDLTFSNQVKEMCEKVYREYGYDVQKIPLKPVSERVSAVRAGASI